MGNILLKNILLNDQRKDIFIEGNIIKSIKDAEDGISAQCSCTETIDCTAKAAFPSFVNMHTHAAMTLMRGEGEGLPLYPWLQRIWDLETKLDADMVYWGTKVACLEMIKTGTTAFNDQYWFTPYARQAAVDMGIRPIVSYTILDRFDPEEAKRQREQCQKVYEQSLSWGEKETFAISLHAIYTVSEEMLLWGAEFAAKHGLKIHIHISETIKEVEDCKQAHNGMTPVEYLDSLGILGENVIAAHTLHLTPNDIEILGKRKVTCVHNINSNAKLASGYRFPYYELKAAGAKVCLGTDGCSSSNNLDMLEAMKTTALFQKAFREDSNVLPLDELLESATLTPAKSLGWNTGTIEEGKVADLIIVDTDNTFFLSNATTLSNLVYSAHSDCISSVICNGEFVMRDRVVEGEKEILAKAREQLKRL